jgi:predicted ribosomally synthesized peptide with nif11-like leader
MSEEQLKAFLNALEADTGLQAKLKAAVEGEIDTPDETAAVLAIAKEAGFAITAADLLRFEAQNILELSDEELEGVAGGIDMNNCGDTFSVPPDYKPKYTIYCPRSPFAWRR